MTDMALEPHTAPDGTTPVPGITYLYYDGPVLWPFGWGLSYTNFTYTWFDADAAHQTVDAAAWAAGNATPPSYAVNVTNTGSVVSDVSALAFFSTGLPGEPLQVCAGPMGSDRLARLSTTSDSHSRNRVCRSSLILRVSLLSCREPLRRCISRSPRLLQRP
jgi:hypothetical protein